MPRPPNTEQRRSQIVGGLARVMAERGYAKATIQAIAKAAGLSPGLRPGVSTRPSTPWSAPATASRPRPSPAGS